jgi:hypothetical protein
MKTLIGLAKEIGERTYSSAAVKSIVVFIAILFVELVSRKA